MRIPKQHFFIYLLVNKINGMIYVGETSEERVEDRMGCKGGGYANSTDLYAAIQEFGCENFFYHVLDHAYGESECTILEQHYMDEFDAKNPEIGYNIKDASSNGKHHESTKEQISATLKAQWEAMTPEQQIARAAPIVGWWTGKKRGPRTSEQKEHQSQVMAERHKTQGHPMKGKHQSEEAKAKISAANKGKKQSLETIENMKKAQRAKIDTSRDAELIADYQNGMKIREIVEKYQNRHPYRVLARNDIPFLGKRGNTNKGRTHTDEAKKKVSEAKTKYWADQKAQALIDQDKKDDPKDDQ